MNVHYLVRVVYDCGGSSMVKSTVRWFQRIYSRLVILHPLYRFIRKPVSRLLLKWKISRQQHKGGPIRLILGANRKGQPGWINTEEYNLNITNPKDWSRYFKPGTVDAMLAEHVWEHLTEEEARLAARLCYKYLKPGGYVRVAVPDGNFPSAEYIRFVMPGGTGPSAADHKVLYNYKTLTSIFVEAGFQVELLEFFDEKGNFHAVDWSPEDGIIRRSSKLYTGGHVFDGIPYRSLIIDAKKPV